MKRICFATNNEHKLKEIKALFGDKYEIFGLKEIGCTEELPETKPTIEENSMQKAMYVYEKFKMACFADDSGLEIESLENKPGVDSAFYSGTRDSVKNNQKVLGELEGAINRNAQFKTIISFVCINTAAQFKGIVKGEIIENFSGKEGFGYDPIFKPIGESKTFAEMTIEEKNKISHRAIAAQNLLDYLDNRDDL